MTREETRKAINARSIHDFITLTRSKGNNQYLCPVCGSGTGKNHTGALTLFPDTKRVCCFNPTCELGGKGQDTLGALRIIWGCTEKEVFERTGYATATTKPATQTKTQSQPATPPPAAAVTQEPPRDLTDYYRECHARLNDPRAISYLQARGISLETASRYGIGFDPQADPAKSRHPEPRIICPSTKYHYVARAIRADIQPCYAKMNNKDAPIGIFNESVLFDSSVKRVFVTEGAFDALSILEAGAAAIALNSSNNAEKLIEHLTEHRTKATMILCGDDDPAGHKALETMRAGFKRLNISYVDADINNGQNDPNDALRADRAAFIAAIDNLNTTRPDNVASYMDKFMYADIESFRESKDRKTGFELLDKKARGLYSGLYLVGAITSLGKTTFCTQLADQLAAAGEDVLFFSMEQSRLEIVSKSIARRTAQADITTAVDSLSIRRGYLPRHVLDAAKSYKDDVGDRLSIIEGNFECGISFIGDYVRRYIEETGANPIVFIDYLQILQPGKDDRGRTQTTKETMDIAVTELKRLSRELNLTIFVISSVNRANYLTPISEESFKESGGIEFTADVIWGLQLQVMNDPLFDTATKIKEKREKVKEAKREEPRKVELVCLKNRYGVSSYSCYFDYFPRYDLYVETLEPPELKEEEGAPVTRPKRTPTKPTRQQELNTLLTAFKEIENPIEPSTASLESLADKLDLKKATLRRKLKEFTRLFSIKGDKVTYYPEGELDDNQTELELSPF